jgi:iduronate 2-sulfatase
MKKHLCKFLLLCAFISSVNTFAQKKYNVLFIAVDDMSIAIQAYGNNQAPMPNFQRLMQHGVLFRTAYCPYSMCNPSRTAILSGKRPDETGVFQNGQSMRTNLGAHYKFVPEYFNANGYRTEAFGKITCGHEEEISWDYVYPDKGKALHDGGNPLWWIDTTDNNEKSTIYGEWTDAVIQKMEHPVASPYFYAIGLSTHNPSTPTIHSWDKTGDPSYKELLPVDKSGTLTDVRGTGSDNIILPNTPGNDLDDIPDIALKKREQYPTDEWQKRRHAYYGEVIAADEHIGKLVDELDKLNAWDNTVIVFWSDHGVQLGEHQGLWLKKTLFEECNRVPFLICAPGMKTNVVCDALVELVDIYPTLAELCGLPAPSGMEGSSLVPVLEDPTVQWKKAIFSQVQRHYHGADYMGRAVRTDHYHYNSWDGQGEELYDIVNDPYEYTNLASDPGHTDALNHMRKLLAGGWQGALPPTYPKQTFYKDADGDGYGVSTETFQTYFAPAGYASKNGDCDDSNSRIYPGGMDCIASAISSSEASAISSSRFSLYPNPSQGNIIVSYKSDITGNVTIKVIDMTGRELLRNNQQAIKGQNTFKLDLQTLHSGMYYLKIIEGSSSQKQIKFLIDR